MTLFMTQCSAVYHRIFITKTNNPGEGRTPNAESKLKGTDQMEIFIIIPIVAVIYGWMQTFPAIKAPPAGVNGTDTGIIFGNGFSDDYVQNDDSLFTYTDDDIFSTGMSFDDDMHLSSSISFDDPGCGIDPPDMLHEMMFNPIFEWNSFNIFHHDDISHDMGISDTFSDPFCNSFDACCSIHNFND